MEFYLNNLDLLKKFYIYFKSAAKTLIDISDKNIAVDIAFHANNSPYKADPEKVSPLKVKE
jgi:hypothetical protein